MRTTLKEQIEAVALARKIVKDNPQLVYESTLIYQFNDDLNKFDLALNDAASTLAAVQLAPCPEWVYIQAKKDNLI